MTYHRSPLAGLGSHNHNPPWGPSGGAWWRYDQGWTPNIQGPWYLGYPGFPGDGITIRVPSPAMTEATQQAVQLSRQAVEAAERPLWIRAFNWVKENPMLAAGAVMVTALALQSKGMITNAKQRRRNARKIKLATVNQLESLKAQAIKSGDKRVAGLCTQALSHFTDPDPVSKRALIECSQIIDVLGPWMLRRNGNRWGLSVGQHVQLGDLYLKRVKPTEFFLRQPDGRVRWGTADQVAEDIAYYNEMGALPRSKTNWY